MKGPLDAVRCVTTKREPITAPVLGDLPSTQTAGHVPEVMSYAQSITNNIKSKSSTQMARHVPKLMSNTQYVTNNIKSKSLTQTAGHVPKVRSNTQPITSYTKL